MMYRKALPGLYIMVNDRKNSIANKACYLRHFVYHCEIICGLHALWNDFSAGLIVLNIVK